MYKIIKDDLNIIIVLMDKFSRPSIQIKNIGSELKLDGEFIFDLILVKGAISNRFVKANFNAGEFEESSLHYVSGEDINIKEINSVILNDIDDPKSYLERKEIFSLINIV